MSNLQFPLFAVIASWGEPYALTTNIDTAEFICEDLDEIELAERAGSYTWNEEPYEPMRRACIQRLNSVEEFDSVIGENPYRLVQSLQDKGVYVL